MRQAARRQKAYYDRQLKTREYKTGDWVWRFFPPTANKKLGDRWRGPYLVIRRISDWVYEIQEFEGGPLLEVHPNNLKPCTSRKLPTSWLPDTQTTPELDKTTPALDDQSDAGSPTDDILDDGDLGDVEETSPKWVIEYPDNDEVPDIKDIERPAEEEPVTDSPCAETPTEPQEKTPAAMDDTTQPPLRRGSRQRKVPDRWTYRIDIYA